MSESKLELEKNGKCKLALEDLRSLQKSIVAINNYILKSEGQLMNLINDTKDEIFESSELISIILEKLYDEKQYRG